jgi:WD40 repeat protein
MLLYEDHKSIVYSLAFSPDGSTLAGGARDGSVYLREANGRRHSLTEPGSQSLPIYSVSYTPDGSSVLIGGAFGWLGCRRDNESWRIFGPQNAAPVTSLAMLDDKTLAVGIGDRVKTSAGKFELWDITTGKKREPHFLEPNGVRAVAVCPEKRMVAWATGHRKVCVWSIVKDRPIEFTQPKPCLAVALSPDGTQLAVAVDYSIKLYATDNSRRQLELKGHKGQVSAVSFSPDGSTIATGSWDQTVKLWDAATGREQATFSWSIGRVYCLAYAPDGLRLAAGSDVGKIVVWDME